MRKHHRKWYIDEPIDLEKWKRELTEDEKQMIRKFIKRLEVEELKRAEYDSQCKYS